MLDYFFIFLLGFLFGKYLKPLQQWLFPSLMNQCIKGLNKEFIEFKSGVFKGLKDMESHFPDMRERNSIKILEIGVGTGANFQFYPDGCHLTVVDPNPNFKHFYNQNRSQYPQIKSEDILVCGGEDMYPVPDKSVDVVVITWVLCSVKDISKVMEQVVRVLVPGGKMIFFEHVKEWDREKHSKRFHLQTLLTFIGVWPFFFDGCELDREILSEIKAAGFSKVDYEYGYAPDTDVTFDVERPHCFGVATK